MKIGRQSNFFVWSLTTKLSEMETKSNADKMKGRLLFTSPLVLATKALRPPFLSERWLFHKEGLRLRIICWWCNYTAGCTQRCKKYLDGCNYTLRTGWNVQKEECFHVAQICCRGVKLASALKWRSHVNLNPPISCIIQMHNTGKRQWRQRWELQLDILPRGGNRQSASLVPLTNAGLR